MFPLAVHISDGVLPGMWWGGGWLVAAALVALGLARLDERSVPRIAVFAAAFFVGSLIHVPLGVSSVHLLLNGLIGIVLGRRAGVAIALGLLMQLCFLGHGGWTTLGVNICCMTVPALIASVLFQAVRRVMGDRWSRSCLPIGFALGMLTVLLTSLLNVGLLSTVITRSAAMTIFIAHLPLAVIEGAIVAVALGYLNRAAPEYLEGSLRE